MLEENFNNEKDRMFEEIEKRERYLEGSNLKIETLENELIKYREASSGVVADQIVNQEKKFYAQLTDFNRKRMEIENEYICKIEDIRHEYDVKLEKMSGLIKEKDEFISRKEKFMEQRQEEERRHQNLLNQKIENLNTAIAEERRRLSEKEKIVDKKILDSEIENSKKMNELEKMKMELSRVIQDYKKKSEK